MRVVIVGTGTEVGKTHLTVALLTALARQDVAACGLKPIESGTGTSQVGPDAAALAAASSAPVKHPPPYAFADPVSPHLAARRAGVHVDLGRVQRWVDEHEAPWVLVETAGALLSPLGPGLTNLDLALAVAPTACILVGVDRLGVLHDVSACLLAALWRPAGSVPAITVALQAPPIPDASTGTNAAELGLLGIAENAFTMPRAPATSPAYQEAARRILAALAPPPGMPR